MEATGITAIKSKTSSVNVDGAAAMPLPPIHRNAFSFVTLSWLNPLLRRGRAKPLQQNDLPELPACEKAAASLHTLDGFWARARSHAADPASAPPPNLMATLIWSFLGLLLACFMTTAIKVAINITLPLMIEQIIDVLGGKTTNLVLQSLEAISALFFAFQLTYTLLEWTTQSMILMIDIRLRAAVTDSIYKKFMRLSPKSRAEFPAGTINSFVSIDITNLSTIAKHFFALAGSTAQIILAMYYLVVYLGLAAWISVCAYVFLFSIQMAMTPIAFHGQAIYLSAADNRIKRLREFLYGIKIIKFQAAEEFFEKEIYKERAKQLVGLRRFLYASAGVIIGIVLQQDQFASISFIAYAALGHQLEPGVVFTALGLVGALMGPSGVLGPSTKSFVQAIVSYGRIAKFLMAEEIQPDQVTKRLEFKDGNDLDASICLEDATFTWMTANKGCCGDTSSNKDINPKDADKAVRSHIGLETISQTNAAFTLKHITLSVPRGSLVGVVGVVGSGKSSLLEALVGSMPKTAGTAAVCGTMAYCAQEPWILSGTVEDNIVFGNELARKRVSAAVNSACLSHDLAVMPAGLGTQIGEKGIMLSGGQRARIALARAIAHDADVVLLDDPLAALDAHVGRLVFENTICGALRGKTVLLATHQLHVLPKTDMIVVMDNGCIVETGTFRDLMAKPNSELTKIMQNHHFDEPDIGKACDTSAKGDVSSVASTLTVPDEIGFAKDDEALATAVKKYEEEKVIEEDRRTGSVTFKTFKSYFQAGGIVCVALLFLTLLLNLASNATVRISLAVWTGDMWGWAPMQYLLFYAIVSVVDCCFALTQTAMDFVTTYSACTTLHNRAVASLMKAPMHFFDAQPVGRVLSRLTTDVEALDAEFVFILITSVYFSLCVVSSAIAVVYANALVLIAFLLLIIFAVWLFRFFQATYRELKRLQSIMRSPLAAHISESLNGTSTISAYGAQEKFITQMQSKVDLCNMSNLLIESAQFWVGLRLQLSSSLVTLCLLLLLCTGRLSGPTIGLALVATTGFGEHLNELVLYLGRLEAAFNSVERLDHYAHDLPFEAGRVFKTDPAEDAWPRSGAITIKDLEIRYPSHPDHVVITGLTAEIRAGEKVAVVGRTGSGKSTLMTALFRIIEASNGSIMIDGVDIARLGLQTLRSRLQIIPQEPILFDGTVRSNIDMHSKHTDNELWVALDMVGLKEYVNGLEGKLDAIVTEGGTNLSAGQRQLVCLCRAVLAKPKVLVMDEATAAVDADADRRIQFAVSNEFRNTTVLSIAHRLNTIAAFDRVLVLDKGGVVAEFDTPHALLQQANSMFAELVDATGQANAAVIREIAANHFAEK